MSIEAGADQIDVRDVIERIEELEALRDAAGEAAEDYNLSADEGDQKQKQTVNVKSGDVEYYESDDFGSDEAQELANLTALMDELKGYGGDEEWRGDWYPIGLIEDSYFETAMDDLIADIGELPKDLPSYLTVTINYSALQQDYSSVEYDGFTYWYR